MNFKIFLEYQEELMDFQSGGLIDYHDFDTDLEEDDDDSYEALAEVDYTEDDDEELEECNHAEHEYIAFMPMWLYRNPINQGFQLDCSFDTTDCKQLHLVIVRYNQDSGEVLRCGLWTVYEVCKTRREASELASRIENNEIDSNDLVWKKQGCTFENVGVCSLSIED